MPTLENRIAALEKSTGTTDSVALIFDNDEAPTDGSHYIRVRFVAPTQRPQEPVNGVNGNS